MRASCLSLYMSPAAVRVGGGRSPPPPRGGGCLLSPGGGVWHPLRCRSPKYNSGGGKNPPLRAVLWVRQSPPRVFVRESFLLPLRPPPFVERSGVLFIRRPPNCWELGSRRLTLFWGFPPRRTSINPFPPPPRDPRGQSENPGGPPRRRPILG